MVLRLLTIYFLWSAIFRAQGEVFGYDERQILTYILLSQVLSATVFSTRTHEVGTEINDGRLSNFLLKPVSYFRYWWARDISDKVLNTGFSIVEITVVIAFLQPKIAIQTDLVSLIFFALSVIASAVLYFYISFLLSLTGFWIADVWAPRFLFFVITDFLSGGLFPLDILPKKIFAVLKWLPFTYLQFFPLKIYLGDIARVDIVIGFFVMTIWLCLIYFAVQYIWHKGLRFYEAQGR